MPASSRGSPAAAEAAAAAAAGTAPATVPAAGGGKAGGGDAGEGGVPRGAATSPTSPLEAPPRLADGEGGAADAEGGRDEAGPSVPITDPEVAARQMAQYEVGPAVGRGGYAVVYKCTRKTDGATVALKNVEVFNMSERKRARCLGEVQLLRSLTHPHIIKLEESFVHDNNLIIVTEWANNGDLRRLIRKAGARGRDLEEPLVWKYFGQIADALAYMHRNRIMHRDLKPANVLVSKGNLKLADLGLGRHFGPETQEAFSKVGTPYYVSPEVVRGTGYSWKSDVWSLGALLYELATLRCPFELPEDQKEALKRSGDDAALGEKKSTGLYAVFRRIAAGQYDPLPAEKHSPALRRLVGLMLKVDANARPDAEQVLAFAQAARESGGPGGAASPGRDAALLSERAMEHVVLLSASGAAAPSRAVEEMLADGRLHALAFASPPASTRTSDSEVDSRTFLIFASVCAYLLRTLGTPDAELEVLIEEGGAGSTIGRDQRLEACQRLRGAAEASVQKAKERAAKAVDEDAAMMRQNVPPPSAAAAMLKGHGAAAAGVVAALASTAAGMLNPTLPRPAPPPSEPAIPIREVDQDEHFGAFTAEEVPDDSVTGEDGVEEEDAVGGDGDVSLSDERWAAIEPSVNADAWRAEAQDLAERGAFTVMARVDGAGCAAAQARAAKLRLDVWQPLSDCAPRLASATSEFNDNLSASLSAIAAFEARVNGIGATPDAAVASLKARALDAAKRLQHVRVAFGESEARIQAKALNLVRVEEASFAAAQALEEAGACLRDPELGRQRYIVPMRRTIASMQEEMREMDFSIERHRALLIRGPGSTVSSPPAVPAEEYGEEEAR